MAIDVHAHGLPARLVETLEQDGGRCGVEVVHRDGNRFLRVAGGGGGPLRNDFIDVDARLAAMDTAGIAVQLMSTWVGVTGYTLPADQGARWARLFNESLAAFVADHPDRFGGLGHVPLQAPVAAADELRHAVQRLGLVGAEIATTVDGRELDDPDLEPFWAAAEELRCLILLHPDQRLPGRSEPRYFLNNLVGNAAETTIAVSHLVFGGVLDRHPELRMILVHGGGYLPWQAGRLDHGHEAVSERGVAALRRRPSEQLRTLYYDTVTHSSAALRFLIDFAGADHVVLGSDYPFEMGQPDPVGLVDGVAGLSSADRQRILDGTVQRLLSEVDHAGSAHG